MPISEAKRLSNKKWNDANLKERYDRINLVVYKGERATIKDHAATQDESLNAFITRAIAETIERDKQK